MTSQSSSSTRKQSDFTKLLIAGYDVELLNGSTTNFHVIFRGPKETAYEKGVWKVLVSIPPDYPFASPSIGFANKILHPNIDEASGSVCLDVINQQWTPLYSLVNIFEIFLPQLLTYPNPSDPLNSEAASLLLSDKAKYFQRVAEYVRTYASEEIVLNADEPIPTTPDATASPGIPNNEGRRTSADDATATSSLGLGNGHTNSTPSDIDKAAGYRAHALSGSATDGAEPSTHDTLCTDSYLDDFDYEDDDLLDDEAEPLNTAPST